MKRFVIRAFLYVFLVVGVLGGLCLWEVIAEIRAYHREIIAPEGASILVCGDSQLGNSVNPDLAPSVFNFSAHGRAVDQTCMVVQDIVTANPGKFKYAVVDVSPAAAMVPLDRSIDKMAFAGNYWLLHYLHPDGNERNLMTGFRAARDYLVRKRLRHVWRAVRGIVPFESSLCGGYTPFSESKKLESPPVYVKLAKAKAEETKGSGQIRSDSALYRILSRLSRKLAADGVKTVVVTTPWHRDLTSLCRKGEMENFAKGMADWARRAGIRYENFLNAEFPDDCWQDANHLNERGARIFTRMLLAKVKQ